MVSSQPLRAIGCRPLPPHGRVSSPVSGLLDWIVAPPMRGKDGRKTTIGSRHTSTATTTWSGPGKVLLGDPNVQEKEAIMCIPVGYTRPCLPKNQQGSTAWEDTRLTLIGNSWHVGVITWLLEQLLGPLGFCRRQVSRSPRSGKLPDARTQWNFAGNPPSPTLVVKQNVG